MKTKEEILIEFAQWIKTFGGGIVPIQHINDRIDTFLSEAIAEYEASKWKNYPENKPEKGKWYLIQDANGGESNITCIFDTDKFTGNDWYWHDLRMANVIAFRELPSPYQEGGDHAII